MPYKNKENKHTDTVIELLDLNFFIGAKIYKTSTTSVCVGIGEVPKKDGTIIKVFFWETVFNADGRKRSYYTSSERFRIGDIRATERAFKECT
jgi:hypothetical protein